jgi:hypothetical protein
LRRSLRIARARGYITPADFAAVDAALDRVRAMLWRPCSPTTFQRVATKLCRRFRLVARTGIGAARTGGTPLAKDGIAARI